MNCIKTDSLQVVYPQNESKCFKTITEAQEIALKQKFHGKIEDMLDGLDEKQKDRKGKMGNKRNVVTVNELKNIHQDFKSLVF